MLDVKGKSLKNLNYDSCRLTPNGSDKKNTIEVDDEISGLASRRKSLVQKIFESEHQSQRENDPGTIEHRSEISFIDSARNMSNVKDIKDKTIERTIDQN